MCPTGHYNGYESGPICTVLRAEIQMKDDHIFRVGPLNVGLLGLLGELPRTYFIEMCF